MWKKNMRLNPDIYNIIVCSVKLRCLQFYLTLWDILKSFSADKKVFF